MATDMVRTGLDIQAEQGFPVIGGKRVGLLCNQATIDRSGRHILELLPHDAISTIFGPQHGLWGHTQDNMLEWEGGANNTLGMPVYSLYGKTRRPTPEMLEGLDVLLVDLPDIGSRYYTFAWTMALAMDACAEAGIEVIVLDRPNPLGGVKVEGPILDPDYASFVGLFPLPIRHAMTLGELARHFSGRYVKGGPLTVVEVEGWSRGDLFPATGLPWAPPSPNMPTFSTALVYPGACLLEGTHLSEGRGTTRPFEQFGAPWIQAFVLASRLNDKGLPGVHFRPTEFEPVFHKHGGQLCQGCFVHVQDPETFEPVRTYVEVIRECYDMYQSCGQPDGRFVPSLSGAGAWEERLEGFWKLPPYEYEYEKAPIDILWGSDSLRLEIEA